MRSSPNKKHGSVWTLIAFWLGAAFIFYVVVMLLWLAAVGVILWL